MKAIQHMTNEELKQFIVDSPYLTIRKVVAIQELNRRNGK